MEGQRVVNSARGLAHSKTLREPRGVTDRAVASWSAVVLHRFSKDGPSRFRPHGERGYWPSCPAQGRKRKHPSAKPSVIIWKWYGTSRRSGQSPRQKLPLPAAPGHNPAAPDRDPPVPDGDPALKFPCPAAPDRDPTVGNCDPLTPDRGPALKVRRPPEPDRDPTPQDRCPPLPDRDPLLKNRQNLIPLPATRQSLPDPPTQA